MNRSPLGVEIPPPEPGINIDHCEGCGGRLSPFQQKDVAHCLCGSATTRVMLVTLKEIARELRLIREVAERSEEPNALARHTMRALAASPEAPDGSLGPWDAR